MKYLRRWGLLDSRIFKLDLTSQFIELLDVVVDEKDREVLKYDGKDMEESQELDLPEIADDTGTNGETVIYGYEGIDAEKGVLDLLRLPQAGECLQETVRTVRGQQSPVWLFTSTQGHMRG